ncbi:MAG TPA: phosphoglycerate mutase [Chloroflexi bacterium]|nr:phosphoglycerate mutase [Chloroflexota bacterium]
MTILHLIRHGHNEYIEKGLLAGRLPGVHLSERGKRQAESLARATAQVPLRAVYASPLERTMETARPIAEAHGLEVAPRPGLIEIGYGTWQGRSFKVLRRRKLWRTLLAAPSLVRFPQGESFMEAQARVVTELEALRGLHPGKRAAIACVTHADIIKLAIAHYLGLPLDLFRRLVVEPGSITSLVIEDAQIRLLRLNDTHAANLTGSL